MDRLNVFSWIRRVNIIKILISPQLTYRFNGITIKILGGFLVEI